MTLCISSAVRSALCLAALLGGLHAQSLATTFAGGHDLGSGGAIYFDLECTSATGIEISSMVFHFADPVGTTGTVDVNVAPENLSSLEPWSLLACSIAVTAVGAGAPTPMPLPSPSPMQMGPGCSYRVAVVANGLRHSYSAGLTTSFSNAELTLDGGLAGNSPFGGIQEQGVTPNLVVFYQTGGSCLPLAKAESIGSGCGDQASSAYQFVPPAAGIQSLRFVKDAASDAVTIDRTVEPLQPVGQVRSPIALSLGNNTEIAVGSYGLVVGSNGWVARGSGNSTQPFGNDDL